MDYHGASRLAVNDQTAFDILGQINDLLNQRDS
jgi:hypothetical protein